MLQKIRFEAPLRCRQAAPVAEAAAQCWPGTEQAGACLVLFDRVDDCGGRGMTEALAKWWYNLPVGGGKKG